MKHYEQLHYLQTLLDDGILTDAEFSEQKSSILDKLQDVSIQYVACFLVDH